jgi:ligand-binding sensor domain-containing protein
MQKKWILKFCCKIVIFNAIIILTNACEKVEEDLKDPSDAGYWTVYNTTTGLPGNQVRGIKGDKNHNIWFAFSSNGVAKFSNNAWTYYNTSNSNILSNGVTCIEEDGTGNIIFGTTNGLSKLMVNGSWNFYRDPYVTMTVNVIKAASNGTIWVGTRNQGFFISSGSVYTQFYVSQYKNVNDIEEDSKGNIWIATDNGLLKWDGTNFSSLTTANGLPDNIVTALFSDSKNRLWIGTYFGTKVSWIDNNGIHTLSLLNGNMSCEVNDIWEDRKGEIWFATYDSGLIRFDGVLPHTYKKYNGFPENDIISIGEDTDGNIWFGLYSKGLVKYTLSID